ncbi:hypothetical protein [Halovivax sp.]|uniref:hypothetical protein n=1 Tax=Halovivax sp. TaxID=1935978 RepID=UPI0025C120F8|nr:hypothetical protein [Halovivax sp.]
MAGLVRGSIRGVVAWIGGYLLTLAVLVAGVVDAPDGAARTFLEAHTVLVGAGTDPVTMVAVPVVVLGAVGYRMGSGIESGLVGRLRSSVGSLLGSSTDRTRTAVEGAVYLAVGYAVVAAVAAAVVGTDVGETAVSSLLVALLVGVPAAFVGPRF